MYGTIAKIRLKQGVSGEEMQRTFQSLERPEGSRGVFALVSKEDPGVVWIGGVFESEDVYYRTAASPAQSERFATLRALMDGDPEWHDGEVIDFTTY